MIKEYVLVMTDKGLRLKEVEPKDYQSYTYTVYETDWQIKNLKTS